MEILKWKDKTWDEIPSQDNPVTDQNAPPCLVICKQGYQHTTHVDEYRFEVLRVNNGEAKYLGLFWEIQDAELFAESYSTITPSSIGDNRK